MVATVTRPRPALTPERWQAALQRAFAENIQLRQLAGCGLWIATSSKDATVAYEVSRDGCECPAGQFGDLCKHRALFFHQVEGTLDLDPEPTPITAVPARNPFGLSDSEMVALRGEAARLAAEHNAPLDYYLSA
jgi:hypothetical protein